MQASSSLPYQQDARLWECHRGSGRAQWTRGPGMRRDYPQFCPMGQKGQDILWTPVSLTLRCILGFSREAKSLLCPLPHTVRAIYTATPAIRLVSHTPNFPCVQR